MFIRYTACFVVGVISLFIIGCGTDEVITPGEEVVVDEWENPVDIGKEYTISIEEIQDGDEVTLSTGERYSVKKFDIIDLTDEGAFLTTLVGIPDPRDPNAIFVTDEIPRGYVVLEGPPIVTLYNYALHNYNFQGDDSKGAVTKEGNVVDYVSLPYSVEIDRVLDYALPIYLEYQLEDRPELGGGVTKGRFIVVVPKGEQHAIGSYRPFGHYEKHARSSISVLPHTEMQEVDLPATVGHPDDNNEHLPLEYRGIPEGHTFRPYRIRSSSFFMGETSVEENW